MGNSRFLKIIWMLALGFLPACAAPLPPQGHLGDAEERRVVIAGENVKEEIAAYYQKEYGGKIWFTPYKGSMANAANNLIESGLAPSRSLKELILDLKSINYSIGRWEIIVPKTGERYLLKALKNMPASSLAKARGAVVLIDSESFPELEREVQRVSDGFFFVTYQKYAPGGTRTPNT